jgi:glycerol-3-phosphate dehydrogenase
MGDVGLVRTTALERKQIHRLAPHLAEPRWMVVPVRSWTGLLKMRAAITAYETLGAVASADRHRNWGAREIEREEPLLDSSVYTHACAYREYLTDDAHLVLANLRSAAGLGAAAANHLRVDAIVQQAGRATGVEAVCTLTGRRVRVRARCVINAAGPWIEAVRRLENPAAPPLLHLSKGVHVVVSCERLPVRNLLFLATQDRRSIFVMRQLNAVVIGTTDTSWRGGADVWPDVTREDVEYLLDPPARHFRGDRLTPADVIGAWAGLRPLIAQPGKKPSEISRRDEVLIGPAGVVTIAGGKLTGYRPMARETLECAAEAAGLELAPVPAEEPPLPGGDFDGDLAALAARLVRETGVDAAVAARLVRLYGTEAGVPARAGAETLVPGVLASEVDWAIEREGAATLEDLLYRRLRTSLYAGGLREAAVAPAAERMARLLGWDAARRDAEKRQVLARLAADLAFRDEASAPAARAAGTA